MLPDKNINQQLSKIRAICERLPEIEIRSGQHHTFLVRNKKFAYYLIDHHGDGRVSVQCKAEPGLNETLVATDPERFFLPPYMAHHGWIGVYVDLARVDWDELEELLIDAYRLAAPERLSAQL